MMNNFKKFDRSDYINSPEQASEYLQLMLDENGLDGFYKALGDVAKAKGMSDIAKTTGVGRESLYKSLSNKGNPNFSTVVKTLEALDMSITFKAS
jgi:probable addiction module antidote protein